jgi:hypothetical protein
VSGAGLEEESERGREERVVWAVGEGGRQRGDGDDTGGGAGGGGLDVVGDGGMEEGGGGVGLEAEESFRARAAMEMKG